MRNATEAVRKTPTLARWYSGRAQLERLLPGYTTRRQFTEGKDVSRIKRAFPLVGGAVVAAAALMGAAYAGQDRECKAVSVTSYDICMAVCVANWPGESLGNAGPCRDKCASLQ